MDDARMLPQHRAFLLLTVTLTVPMAVAATFAGDWTLALPFFAAMMCALGAPWLIRGPLWARALAVLWPFALWPTLYTAAVDIVQLFPDRYLDDLLAEADQRISRGRSPDTWQLGGPLEELANLIYLSYYAVIPGGALWAWRRHGQLQASRYTLAIFAAFAACALLWLAFPAGGYHPQGSPDGQPYGPFTALMRGIYEASPHYAAAFPSSHVALAFASAGALYRLGASSWIWLWSSGIAWSTVQGQYHYLVDSPPAMALGIAASWWAMQEAPEPKTASSPSLQEFGAWREPP